MWGDKNIETSIETYSILKIQADWIGLTTDLLESGGDKLQQIWDHERPKAEPYRASPLFGRQTSRYLDPTNWSNSSPTQVDAPPRIRGN